MKFYKDKNRLYNEPKFYWLLLLFKYFIYSLNLNLNEFFKLIFNI